jgi:hypothetical protein
LDSNEKRPRNERFEKIKVNVIINECDDDTRAVCLYRLSEILLHLEFPEHQAFKEDPKVDFGWIDY